MDLPIPPCLRSLDLRRLQPAGCLELDWLADGRTASGVPGRDEALRQSAAASAHCEADRGWSEAGLCPVRVARQAWTNRMCGTIAADNSLTPFPWHVQLIAIESMGIVSPSSRTENP